MAQFKYIVQIHLVEHGDPNQGNILADHEFFTKEEAEWWLDMYNTTPVLSKQYRTTTKAVYVGCTNNESGEVK